MDQWIFAGKFSFPGFFNAVERLSEEVKRYHCCICFADDLNLVAISSYMNFDLILRGKKVHRFTLLLMLHFA